MIEYGTATESDWGILYPFYCEIYRAHHPLRNFKFWRWQFLGQGHSGCFIACDHGRVVGHVGAYFSGGYFWLINGYLKEKYRGQGIFRELYALARNVYPLAMTNGNKDGLGPPRYMKWTRYCDLQRYVTINPAVKNRDLLCDPLNIDPGWDSPKGDYYWTQPFLKGFLFPDGSTAVNRLDVGGLCLVDLINVDEVVSASWNAGVTWIDFVTSWNDPLCRALEKKGWYDGEESPVPWLLDPVVPGSKARIAYLSEKPMPQDFIVKRTCSDHGRIGSLPDAGSLAS